jgi:hypothetical protein
MQRLAFVKNGLRFVWNNSLKRVIQTLAGKLSLSDGRRKRNRNEQYRDDLLELFWSFIRSRFPREALSKEDFVKCVLKYQNNNNIIKSNNIYFADLWYLFAPDFRNRLPEYYDAMQLHHTMRFLEYASYPDLIKEHYARPYQIAREVLGKFSVLELGAGIPHGLIYESLYGGEFCERLTLVEIQSVYTEFVQWFCNQRGISFELVTAEAAGSTVLPKDGEYDFIFAKDIFEHLQHPKEMAEQLIAVASKRAILAFDIEDKGEEIYEHIHPQLSPLRSLLSEKGWIEFDSSGNTSLWRRVS